jgi:hypothetical protein
MSVDKSMYRYYAIHTVLLDPDLQDRDYEK